MNPADAKVLGEAKLSGHPESFQLERSGSRAFVNVPTADQIAVVDRNAMKVVATWSVVSAKANFPMALDEANHRLFIGCRRPAKVLVYDTDGGKEIDHRRAGQAQRGFRQAFSTGGGRHRDDRRFWNERAARNHCRPVRRTHITQHWLRSGEEQIGFM